MPQAVTDLLKSLRWYKPETDPSVHPCEGSKFHSPRPMKVRPFRLTNGRTVYLCGVCRDNVNLFMGLQKHNSQLSWDVQRSFGNEVRKLSSYILRIGIADGIQ